MSRRTLGIALIGAGALLTIIGLVGWVASMRGATADEAAATTQEEEETTSTDAATTTVNPPTTTTTLPPTTTTVPATTTTAFDTSGAIEQYVADFANAIADENVDFLFDTLHPVVLDLFDEESCRTFIADEILQLEGYRITGPVEGPTRRTIGDSSVSVYTAPVSFTFQGQDFASDSEFAFVGAEVRWFTQCGAG